MPTSSIMEKDSVEYLQSLKAIRDRCTMVLNAAKEGKLNHFELDLSKMDEVDQFLIELIQRDYGPTNEAEVNKTIEKIPPHGRWRHFGNDNLSAFMSTFSEKDEMANAMIDLFVVGTLLDAGAGDAWKFKDTKYENKIIDRSEGLAVASLRMIEGGLLSGDDKSKRVDSVGLKNLTTEKFKEAFQVSEANPLVGVEGRLSLLHRLASILESKSQYFPTTETGLHRPSDFVNYLKKQANKNNEVDIKVLWEVIINGFGPVWPESRLKMEGKSLGDVWPCEALEGLLLPFHKLSQWLTYSLLEPIQQLAGVKISGTDALTGLTEYRNGGLYVDLGVLKLKETTRQAGLAKAKDLKTADQSVPIFSPDEQPIIEWRALTLALMDVTAERLRAKFKLTSESLPLPKILEAGTWKGGREIARKLRPSSGGPPIAIISDGTLF